MAAEPWQAIYLAGTPRFLHPVAPPFATGMTQITCGTEEGRFRFQDKALLARTAGSASIVRVTAWLHWTPTARPRATETPQTLPKLETYFRKTEMDRPGNSVIQKRRGRPFNPDGIDPVISFRMDYHLGTELQPVAQPKAQTSKPLPGYSRTTQKRRWQPNNSGRTALLIRRHKHTAQEPDATWAVLESMQAGVIAPTRPAFP